MTGKRVVEGLFCLGARPFGCVPVNDDLNLAITLPSNPRKGRKLL